MKRNIALFSFFWLSIILFKNCTPQKIDMQNLHRQWMLIEFKDFSKEKLIELKANIDFSNIKTKENQYNAFMGCNKIFFNVEIQSKNKIKFSNVSSTMMYCEDSMNLEDQFSEALPSMTNYKVEGHFLILSDTNGNQMKFVASDWD